MRPMPHRSARMSSFDLTPVLIALCVVIVVLVVVVLL